MTKNTLEIGDNRSFFEKTLFVGVHEGRITREKVDEILSEGSDGIIQIAQTFDTPYLRTGLESARDRMVTLVSLYLENESQGKIDLAIDLINQKHFLELSRGGSDMIKKLGGIMLTDEDVTKEDNIKTAYALFSKVIPWNKGGILPQYQNQLKEYLQVQKKILFTKKLVQLTGIQNYDFSYDDIQKDIFLPVITGRKIEAEYLKALESGKYNKGKWTDLLAKLDSEFGELCQEYSFQQCMFLILDRKEQNIESRTQEEQEAIEFFDNQNNKSSEWNLLFPEMQRHTTQQYITAVLTGAIDGKMKKTITLDEFIGICEKARKQKKSLSQFQEYISKNATPSLDIYSIIIDRLDRYWRDILQKKAPINRRTHVLKFLIQDINISDFPTES